VRVSRWGPAGILPNVVKTSDTGMKRRRSKAGPTDRSSLLNI
jgi:hypothetical protein